MLLSTNWSIQSTWYTFIN
uniref:Uncharacterized protein n=1 Tax=Rhizophora mucronata TaxID=61149 RepID=A0A2P2PHC7_RHIMU